MTKTRISSVAAALLFLALTAILTGCQTASEPTANPDRAAVSSIPWNRPASWEGSGALGGFMPQGGR
jgi:hypothetical protein